MEPGKRIGVNVAIDPRQVPHGSAGADERFLPAQRSQADVVERPMRIGAERLDLVVGRRVVLQEPVAQQQRSQVKAPRPDRLPILEARYLHAAAADVEDDSRRHVQAVAPAP